MKVKFLKKHPDAIVPKYANPGDGGMDLVAIDNGKFVHSPEGDPTWYYVEYDTGLSCEFEDKYVGLLFPRSSGSKTALILSNSVGVLDSGFRGNIKARFKVDANLCKLVTVEQSFARYKKGDKIIQLVIVPFERAEIEEVTELSETERGEGGFGSSGA
jgi:dUTP pyrophosphatase